MNVSSLNASDLSLNTPVSDFEDWIIDLKPITHVLTSVIGETNNNAPFLAPDLVNLVVEYVKNTSMFVFGEKDWKQHFGEVPSAPALPSDIEAILQSVKNRCMLVYIPLGINDNVLYLREFKKLVRDVKCTEKNSKEFNINIDFPQGMYIRPFDPVVESSHWALITEEVLSESIGMTYEKQKALIEESIEKWSMVDVRDAAISMTLRSIFNGKNPFCTRTRISKSYHEGTHHPVIFNLLDSNGSGSEGIRIYSSERHNGPAGVAVMQKFFYF